MGTPLYLICTLRGQSLTHPCFTTGVVRTDSWSDPALTAQKRTEMTIHPPPRPPLLDSVPKKRAPYRFLYCCPLPPLSPKQQASTAYELAPPTFNPGYENRAARSLFIFSDLFCASPAVAVTARSSAGVAMSWEHTACRRVLGAGQP